MGMIIDLSRRFGGVEPDITKRKSSPDEPSMNWRAWNKANPKHNPKGADGRWRGAMGHVRAAWEKVTGGRDEEWVRLPAIRQHLEAQGFDRREQDAALRELAVHQDFRIIPVANLKSLSEEDRAAALFVGGEDKHAITFVGPGPVPAPKGEPLPGLATREIPRMIEIQRQLKDPNLTPAERDRLQREHDELNDRIIGAPSERDRERDAPSSGRDPKQQTLGLLKDLGADTYDDWDDADLAALRAHAATLIANVDGAQKRRKAAAAAAKPKRATARLTGKAEPDYEAMVAEIRGAPLLPESEAEIRGKLAPLTIPQLKALAGKADIPVSSKMRKPEIQDRIVEVLHGGRMTSDSVMNYGDPGRFDRRRAEVAAAKGTSGLERLMGGKWEAPAAKADAKAPDQHVRAAFAELKSPTNQWVGLADIREKLEARGLNREQQDAAFMDMLRHDADVRIIPVANSKALKPRDREAALLLGGSSDNPVHAMSISDENRQWQDKRPRPTASAKPMRDQIADTYGELRDKHDNPWVALSQLRPKLGADRAEQDRALMELLDAKQIRLIPEENQKTLTDQDRAAALRLSGEDKHLIGFQYALDGRASAAPAAKVTAKPRTPRAKVDMDAVDQEITAMIADPKPEHRERLREILGGMTVAQLQQVAEKHGTSGFLTGANKGEKADRLVENIVGFRLNALAIMGSKWTDHADSTANSAKERAIAKAEAELETLKGRLGLAEDKRRRSHGGRIATAAESKLRTQISEKRREISRLRDSDSEGKA